MFALSVELLSDDEKLAIECSGAFDTVVHVDKGIQVQENELEVQIAGIPEDEELASVAASVITRPAAASSADGRLPNADPSSSRPSPFPRRSDGASPWFLEDEGEEEGEEGTDEGEEEECGECDELSRPRLELAQRPFFSGHSTSGELRGAR